MLPAQPLGGWLSVGSNNDVQQGWRGLEEAESSANAPALPTNPQRQLCKPAPIPQSGAGAADCTIPRDGARRLMFRPGRCQPAHFLHFIFPLLPATLFFFIFHRLTLPGCGESGITPPPAQPSWYDPTPQNTGEILPLTLSPVKQSICLELGRFLDHSSSSSSLSSSQPISEG